MQSACEDRAPMTVSRHATCLVDVAVARVLVVEDDDDAREAVLAALHGHFDTRAARDGAEALRILRYELVDAILLDLHMPGMDGEEFLAAYGHLARRPP